LPGEPGAQIGCPQRIFQMARKRRDTLF